MIDQEIHMLPHDYIIVPEYQYHNRDISKEGSSHVSPPLFTVGFNSVWVLNKFSDWHHSVDFRLLHLAFRVLFVLR